MYIQTTKYFPRVLHYLKPYRRAAWLAVFLVVLGAGFSLLTPWPLQILIDNVFDRKPFPRVLGVFLNPIADRRVLLLVLVTSASLLITLLKNPITVLSEYVMTKIDKSMVLNFRSDLILHAQRFSLAFHDHRRTGKIIFAINQ